MAVISVDPGLRASGVAVWAGGQLVRAELARIGDDLHGPRAWTAMALAVKRVISLHGGPHNELVVELPRTYGGRASRGDANDLIQLAAVVGAIVQECGDIRMPSRGHLVTAAYPQDWKGQQPKEITRQRVEAELSPEELARIELPSAASLQHNVFDAIGIGLWSLGRSGRPLASTTRRG